MVVEDNYPLTEVFINLKIISLQKLMDNNISKKEQADS